MQKIFYSVIFVLFLMAGCKQTETITEHKTKAIQNETKIRSVDTLVLNDLNNDKIADTAFVTNPMYIGDDILTCDCIDKKCDATVRFSNGLPAIGLSNAIGATMKNIGDIDNDGYAELLIVHQWFVGCNAQIHFYTLRKNSWVEFGKVRARLCDDDEDLKDRVTKINNNSIKVRGDSITEDIDIIPIYRILKLH